MANARQKKKYYTTYMNDFKKIVEKKIPVTGKKFDTDVSEVIENVEDYRQCYRKGFKVLEDLPKYWFVSKEGFLISLYDNEPKWVKPNMDKVRPEFKVPGKNKGITPYQLTGLVWGSYIEPDAYKLLFDNGIKCLGANRRDKEKNQLAKVQAHHIAEEGYVKDKTMESYIFNNRAEYIQFLTNKDHMILGNLNGNWKEDIARIAKADKEYKAVPETQIKIYQYAETNVNTGITRKIPRFLTPEEYKRMIFSILDFKYDFLEKDGVERDGFIFVRADAAEWMRENLDRLLWVAKEHPPKDADISRNIIDCDGKIVYYGYSK